MYFGDSKNELQRQLPAAKRVTAVPTPKKYTPAKIARGLVSRHPLPVQNYTSPEMASIIQWQLKTQAFDIVHLDSIHLAGYLPVIRAHSPKAKVTLDWHNIESELMLRYAIGASGLRRTYALLTAKRLAVLENELLGECYGHLVCSSREMRELSGRNGSSRIAVLENGVDTQVYRPLENAGEKRRLVFVGQMSYHANADGVLWFTKAVWPGVKAKFPELVLTIVGSDPTPEIFALKDSASIDVTGTVPEVLPYYQDAFASIVPLQVGGGTRLKILEAMAAGAPVISTSIGAEGLDAVPGTHLLLADTSVDSWLRAMETVADPRQRAPIIAEARQLVCRQYDWNAIGNRLAATYESWCDSGE